MTEQTAPPAPRAYDPPAGTGTILLQDDDILVADKPSGLLAVPGRGDARQDCLQRRLEVRFGPLETVHRLDMDTSGLIVFARNKPAGRALSTAFGAHQVSKHYRALVHGVPDRLSGEIGLPVGRDWAMRPLRKIDAREGKPALTRWRVAGRWPGLSLLDLEPVTGRTHQLRVHLQAIGHPICGDRLYGRPDNAERLCLHACQLAFAHPRTGRAVCVKRDVSFGQIVHIPK